MFKRAPKWSYTAKNVARRSLRRLGLDVRKYTLERDQVHCFQQLVRTVSPTVYIDLGCNRGQFFEEYVKPIGLPWSLAIFVDPIEEALQALRRKNESLPLRAKYYAAAVSDCRGEVQLNISARETSSSILDVTSESTARIHETGSIKTRWVRQDTLPGLLGWCDLPGSSLMKIDVQGMEKSVLDGLGSMLRQVAILRIEMSSVELYSGQTLGCELLSWLSDREFEIVGVQPGWMDTNTGICVQWDVTVIAKPYLARIGHV